MKAALIGMGSMGQKHYKALLDNEEVTLAAVVDSDPENLKNIKANAYTKLDEMLMNENIDFAIVATPTSTHTEISKELLENGINLLVEKPIATNSTEAKKLVSIAHRNNCKAVVGHIERFNPAVQTALAHLRKEKIIHCIATRMSAYPQRITDVGVKLDLGIHDIDLLRLINQNTNMKVCAHVENKSISKKEDTAAFMVQFFNGATATITISWMLPFRERKIKILAESCYYEIDLLNLQVNKYSHAENNSYIAEPLLVKREDALAKQLKSFINYIKTDKIDDLCSLEDGLLALSYVEEGDQA